jgi:hypothetical protein
LYKLTIFSIDTVVPKIVTPTPNKIIAIFFPSEYLESFGTDIECSMGGSVIDNVVLVVAPNNPMIYCKCGTVLAKTAERKKNFVLLRTAVLMSDPFSSAPYVHCPLSTSYVSVPGMKLCAGGSLECDHV